MVTFTQVRSGLAIETTEIANPEIQSFSGQQIQNFTLRYDPELDFTIVHRR